MSNITGIDLNGKTVLIRKSWFRADLRERITEDERKFRVSGGFGADPDSSGTKVFGTFLCDGEQTWVRRGDVESVIA